MSGVIPRRSFWFLKKWAPAKPLLLLHVWLHLCERSLLYNSPLLAKTGPAPCPTRPPPTLHLSPRVPRLFIIIFFSPRAGRQRVFGGERKN